MPCILVNRMTNPLERMLAVKDPGGRYSRATRPERQTRLTRPGATAHRAITYYRETRSQLGWFTGGAVLSGEQIEPFAAAVAFRRRGRGVVAACGRPRARWSSTVGDRRRRGRRSQASGLCPRCVCRAGGGAVRSCSGDSALRVSRAGGAGQDATDKFDVHAHFQRVFVTEHGRQRIDDQHAHRPIPMFRMIAPGRGSKVDLSVSACN